MRRALLILTAVVAVVTATLALPADARAQKVVSTTPGKGGSPHETVEYKAPEGLIDQIRLAAEKTIANCRKSAHRAPMSEKPQNFARRPAGLSA